MINSADYNARGWNVVPTFAPGVQLPAALLNEMENHPEAPGKSSWGTRNVLCAFILSMRPKLILEVGAHIGSAAVAMGAALRANNFGTLYSLEPQEHYLRLIREFVAKAGVGDFVRPTGMYSTDERVPQLFGEPVDMIFLDANHTYSHVMKDLELCDRLLAPNGLMFLDDVGPEMSPKMCSEGRGGVRQALIDYTRGRSDLSMVLFEPPFWLNPCGMGMVWKKGPAIHP